MILRAGRCCSEGARLVANEVIAQRQTSLLLQRAVSAACERSHTSDRTWFFAHTANARSMSGDRPFARLIGDRLPSSWRRYFSFCRKTFDTVLTKWSVTGR